MDKKANLQLLQYGAVALGIAIITITIMISVNDTVTGSFSASDCGGNSTPLNITGTNDAYSTPQTCADAGGIDRNWTCYCAAYNASVAGTTGLGTFTGYYGVIAIVLVLVIIIGLFAYFRSQGEGGGSMSLEFK